ncbi:MAG: histidine phosphatase family protein [Chloroflexi bacterium]|nr:histidine phosphatase family protein [Chloroflexota bacterium]
MADSPLYNITFLRHGESVGNLENRFQGHADFPLTETGRVQARALAERWQAEGRAFDRVFSSPLARARETAEIVCAALNTPLELDPEWMEINNGLLAGLSDEEANQAVPRPQYMTPYTRFGRTGESRWEVYLRAGRAIQRILDRAPGCYLVAAHGGILNMTMYAILGIPIQADSSGPRFMFHNTTFATFTYEPEHHNWRMLHFDHRPHWKED